MDIFIKGHPFRYETENIARMFTREVSVSEEKPRRTGDFAYLRIIERTGAKELFCFVCVGGESAGERRGMTVSDDAELELELSFYRLLCRLYGKTQPWGVMTGVRPAKFAARLAKETGETEARRRFRDIYLVSPEKTELCFATEREGARLRSLARPDGFSLYIDIPFCPSRCSYCSFISKTAQRDLQMIPQYLECLEAELARSAELTSQLGLKPQTVYFGGGTPSILSAKQLERLCARVEKEFDLSELLEYTVEAGRPDTIDAEKLAALKNAGVTRISVNPQTFSDEVLVAAGRRHTADQTRKALSLAMETGFNCVNADLIAGLPLDNIENFKSAVKELEGYGVENITVHALTVKRASRINEQGGEPSRDAAEMVDYAARELCAKGYRPYYMYRQKGTVDNLENVGYSLPGKEGVYNVFIMDEVQTIIACGAAAVTKLVDGKTGRMERIFNYKYPAEYIKGLGELLERKEGVRKFYEG